MGIYEPDLNLDFSSKEWKLILLLVALILLTMIFYFVFLQPAKPGTGLITIKFDKNPLKSSEIGKATVIVSNNTDYDAQNVSISLISKAKSDFDIYPANPVFKGSIDELSKGTSREIAFIINPAKKILPGTYTFIATATLNGKTITTESILTIQN
jgi:hypothetical protein